MKPKPVGAKRFVAFASGLLLFLFAVALHAQSHPHLFKTRPVPTQAGQNGQSALLGDIDQNFLGNGPENMTIVLPGKADLLVNREHHQARGARSLVWRGAAQGDSSHKVTLTVHKGILLGHIQHGNEIFTLRPAANGRTVVEKINSSSFAPEWGHDQHTHGKEMVPPVSGSIDDQSTTTTAPAVAALGATTEIVLMSVYTPQARAAGGGTTQIQGQIQAAVDQANSAFINSNMIGRYRLAYAGEVAYNDSGVITTDLNWVTGDAGVASLRDSNAADMVSLITANGGGYCGIGWVQRNPGSGFAGYAFQVTAQSCLTNQTLAHEHGHNLGMEHNPESAGVTPDQASYPYSFAHWVNGQFRTIMSYDVCSLGCPRVLNYSNPDVLYNGVATGVLDQRDNAQTADNTAAIVAAFRSGGAVTVNNPPVFTGNPIVKPDATQGAAYSSTLAGSASDADNDTLSFSKSAGPAWLIVSANGALSGTPGSIDVGLNNFTVTVSDGRGGSASTTLQINVAAPLITVTPTLTAPTNLAAASIMSRRIDLSWADNSGNESGFKIERSNNGSSFSQIATVGANVTTFSDTKRPSGRTYYYRVRSFNNTNNSGYSNMAHMMAK